MAALKDIATLRSLDLSDSLRVDDDGLSAIGQLHNLQELRLSRCSVTNGGVAQLRNLTRLKTLDLAGTMIDDEALTSLAGLRDLEVLYVTNTEVTPAGAKRFQVDHPKCWVSIPTSTDRE